MRKYVNIYNEKYDNYGVICLLKLLTKTNYIKYIRMPPRRYDIVKPQKFIRELIMSTINAASENFSKIFELRITFVTSYRFMS